MLSASTSFAYQPRSQALVISLLACSAHCRQGLSILARPSIRKRNRCGVSECKSAGHLCTAEQCVAVVVLAGW